jgi:hypothetical protein
VPGPVTTKTLIKDVPGPTVIKTVIKTVPTPAPTEGTLLDYSGNGTEETPSFTVSGDGDYTVSWTFSGNDSQGDGADNFIVTEDGGNDLNASDDLPNVIQTSGSGNTGVTSDTGSHTFDVQADPTCSWTIKVVSAP